MKPAKLIVNIMAGVVGALVSYAAVGALFKGCHPVSFETALQRAAEDLNKKLPLKVDGQTRFDRAEAGPGLKFTYFYTLLQLPPGQPDDALQQSIRGKLLASYRDNPKMKSYRDHNVTLVYRYHNEAGAMVCEIVVAPKDF